MDELQTGKSEALCTYLFIALGGLRCSSIFVNSLLFSQVDVAAMVDKVGSSRVSRLDANNWLKQQQDSMHLAILEQKLAPNPALMPAFISPQTGDTQTLL